jgi:predicted RNase H-like nuclease
MINQTRMKGIGVDGCRAGWFGVRIDTSGQWNSAIFTSIDALYTSWSDGRSMILVDAPIGLPDATSCRVCDTEARKYLGPLKSSSVFNPPTRPVLAATDWESAAEANRGACGKGISIQTWAIVPKIKEVDTFLREDLQRQQLVREMHPEVLFQALNDDQPLGAKKKVSQGRMERLDILERHLSGCRDFFAETSRQHPKTALQPDDILDAMVGAVVAAQYAESLRTMPVSPPIDSAGVRCEMVVPVIGNLPRAAMVTVEMRSDAGEVLYRARVDESAVDQVRAFLQAVE